jgi:hypothetical protein
MEYDYKSNGVGSKTPSLSGSGWVSVLARLGKRLGSYVVFAAKKIRRMYAVVTNFLPSSHYVLLAITFAVGLEMIFALQRWVILVAVLVVVAVIVGVVIVITEEKRKFVPTQTILPILATVGLSGFAFFLPTTPILHLYIMTAAVILFFLLKHGARQAYPIWNWGISLVVYFLNVAFVLGLRFYLYIPVVFLLFIVAVISFLMSLQALRRIATGINEVVLPSLAMGLVLTEITWTLQFLPSHHLIQGGILTTFYYVFFHLVSLSYAKKLTRRDIIEYVAIGTVALGVIIISARWV